MKRDCLDEIRKKRTFEKAEKPEPVHYEGIVTGLNLPKGLGLIETGIVML
jgi:hypothetical protein